MESEKIITHKENYGVNVSAGKVDSLRKISTSFTTVRCYENNFIGVAGAIGKTDEDALRQQAVKSLSRRIPYPCSLGAEKKTVNATAEIIKPADFLSRCNSLTEKVAAMLPRFTASNKINLERTCVHYLNSAGADLRYDGINLIVALMFKDKKSANIQDFSYVSVTNFYDEEGAVQDCNALGTAFLNEVALPDKKLPVIMDSGNIESMLLGDMIAETYCAGAGKLAGKLKTKLFSDKLNIRVSRSADKHINERFFDDEGTPDNNFKLVDNGVFSGLLTNKRSAAMFKQPLSASAGTQTFDSVPSYTAGGFVTLPTANNVKAIAPDAIYIASAQGSDVAPDGTVGLPVQLAFLVQDGKLAGKLPPIIVTANIFDMLGGAYMGTARNSIFQANLSSHNVYDVAVAVRK